MRKKSNIVIICLVVFSILCGFTYNYTYAASGDNSIREHIFSVHNLYDNDNDIASYNFWEGDFTTSDSESDYESVRKKYSQGRGNMSKVTTADSFSVLVRFVLWLKNTDYKKLAENNDKYYLQIARLTLNAGNIILRDRSQDMEEDGTLNRKEDGTLYSENSDKLNAALDIYKNNGNKVTLDNYVETKKEAREVIERLISDISTQYRKINNAIEYKAGNDNNKINDSYDNKIKYSTDDVVKFLQEVGLDELNLTGNAREKVIMAWGNGVSLNDSEIKRLGYNEKQIRIYFKISDAEHSIRNASDSIIREWYSIITEGKHTDWYNNNIINGEMRGKWNKALSQTEKNNMIQEIQKHCTGWTEAELQEAEQTLRNIEQGIIDEHFRQVTGFDRGKIVDDLEEKSTVESYNYKYGLPEKTDSTNGDKDTTDLDTIIDSADSFINSGTDNKISDKNLQQLSESIYTILLIVGIIVAVIIGAILGIRFMTGSVEQQADVKKLLVPYIAGCVVVFGAFGIWKIAVTIIASI